MNRHLFIIGAQRSGTTYLWEILDAHPDVYMARPVRPEPKYFLNPDNAASGYDTYWKKYFSEAGNAKWLGEKGTSYIEREDAAHSINANISGATILVILRDPVERAVSHYHFTKDYGLEPYGIERAIAGEAGRANAWNPEKTSVSPYAYTERGKYMQYLKIWERIFGKDRMILLVAEQFIGNQAAVAALYNRLGIDAEYIPAGLYERVNEGSADRTIDPLPSQLRETLEKTFRPWSQRLSDHFGLDVSCWGGMS